MNPVVELPHPTLGTVKTVRPAVRFLKTPAAVRTALPVLGEHTDQVLAALRDRRRAYEPEAG